MNNIRKYIYLGGLFTILILLSIIKYLNWKNKKNNKKIDELQNNLLHQIQIIKNEDEVINEMNKPKEKFDVKKPNNKNDNNTDTIDYVGDGDFTI